MMLDIGFTDEVTDDRKIFEAIGVFQPMCKSRNEVGNPETDKKGTYSFENHNIHSHFIDTCWSIEKGFEPEGLINEKCSSHF